MLIENTKKLFGNFFHAHASPLSNDKTIEKEYYNHIHFLNFDRLRIFSYFMVPFTLWMLYGDFFLRDFWQEKQITSFMQLDIFLASVGLVVAYVTNFKRPKSAEQVKTWMVIFIYSYSFIHLIWASLVSVIEESTSNNVPTYLLGVYSLALIFFLNGTYLFILLLLSLASLIYGLYTTNLDLNKIGPQYNYSIALIILAWIVSRILYNTRLKTFIATKEIENARNNLDVIVKERTNELQIANEQLVNEINERLKYEKILVNEKKAQEADNLKSVFLANMSHEIRTPLNGILGFSELLDKQDLTQAKKKRYLDIIHLNGQQLLKLIDDILDISMIASNQMRINKISFRLSYLFSDALEFFNRQKKIDNKDNLDIFYSPIKNESDVHIFSDPLRLQQVLNNLIHNSIKFTDAGFIRFGGKIEDDFALIFVEDSGIGIDIEQRKSIFKRFRKGDESLNRGYGGTGLGLSISKGIIELLGGMIWHEPTFTIGSRFCFSIPIISTEDQGNTSDHKKKFEQLRKKRILVIEKSYQVFNFITESFKEQKIINYRSEFSKITPDIVEFNADLIIFDLFENEPLNSEKIALVKSYSNFSRIFLIIPEPAENMEVLVPDGCDKVFTRPINIQLLFTECLNILLNSSFVKKL